MTPYHHRDAVSVPIAFVEIASAEAHSPTKLFDYINAIYVPLCLSVLFLRSLHQGFPASLRAHSKQSGGISLISSVIICLD